MSKSVFRYCENCEKWRGTKEECSECGEETIEKEVEKARGDYYFIPGVDEPLDRVTNVISETIRKKGLEYWMKKTVAEKALETLDKQKAMRSVYEKRDKAGASGSDIHDMIEAVSNGETKPEQVSDEPKVRAWLQFRKDFTFKILKAEETVWDKELGVAGTTDALIQTYSTDIIPAQERNTLPDEAEIETVTSDVLEIMIPKDKILIDYKTGKNVYPKVQLQLSAYKHFIEDDIDRLWAVHLEPDKYNLFEYEDAFEVFKAFLKGYRWMESH